ncbi:MAG: urate oxidase [Tepidisphaeraceae bacterium]
MSFKLTHNAYGKSAVRLTKVVRHGGHHTLFEIDAAVQLEGDFAASYTAGDNRQVIATDTIKNTVYVVAKENAFDSLEQFAVILCRHFLKTYPHVSAAKVELQQAAWNRIAVDGTPHDHAFTGGGSHVRTCTAKLDRDHAEPEVIGGIEGLLVLKTTQSGWADFHSDRYRTLKDTHDRILASKVNATWTFNKTTADGNAAYDAINAAILKAFATTYSPSAQKTIQDMGEAALSACADIGSISFTLPNLHRIPFNLDPFGLKFENDIFVATDEPHGLIHGTVSRG